jgi:hypothetical protein
MLLVSARLRLATRNLLVHRVRVALVLALLAVAATARAAAPSPAYGTRGMVVASESEAARAGRAMFDRGGNAVDAAIATAFALAVTQPFSAGLGGGAFVLIRTGLGEVIAIDARETAPAAATRDMFQQPGLPEGASLRRASSRAARSRSSGGGRCRSPTCCGPRSRSPTRASRSGSTTRR